MKLDVWSAKKKAVEYYESIRSKTLVSGFTKYILTNGDDILIVNQQSMNSSNGYVFRCETRNNVTYCELVN